MFISRMGWALAIAACAALAAGAADTPLVILDTDMRSDCDDAGALGMLHALADRGECEILGVMASTTGPHVVATIDAINTYYGRPDLPVGLVAGEHTRGGDDYAPVVGDPKRFPSTLTNETAEDSAALYRRLLHEAPDNSVKIVVIGGQPCLYQFLQTEADHEGDGVEKTGRELAEAKVQELVLMAANFENPDHAEWNVTLHVPGAQLVAEAWPGPIVYSGYEIGHVIQTGGALTDPETNPVAMSYKLYGGTEGGQGVIGNRSSWDQAAVYYTVRGLEHEGEPIWSLSEPVDVRFDDDGRTLYEENPDADRRYKIQEMPIEDTAALIEELMTQPPRASVEIAAPAPGATVAPGAELTLSLEAATRGGDTASAVFLVDGEPVAPAARPRFQERRPDYDLARVSLGLAWTPEAEGSHYLQARIETSNGGVFYTPPRPVSVVEGMEPTGDNAPDPALNLALTPDANLSGSIEGDQRGHPLEILYNPQEAAYHIGGDWNEYGAPFEADLGLVSEDDPFYWRVEWDQPKNINYLTFGGTYSNQPQPFTMWKVEYRHEGEWRAIREGQGGWINTGTFVWGQAGGPAIVADALRVAAYSDGEHPLWSIHLRGRGGLSAGIDDSETEPKASLILYKD